MAAGEAYFGVSLVSDRKMLWVTQEHLNGKTLPLVCGPFEPNQVTLMDQLSPAASERGERLARIVALAHQALGDADQAREWLNAPHPLLGSARPIEVAATDLGARQVERILHNIEYDVPV
jgi:uncharacterized protein (DUF2384 family)